MAHSCVYQGLLVVTCRTNIVLGGRGGEVPLKCTKCLLSSTLNGQVEAWMDWMAGTRCCPLKGKEHLDSLPDNRCDPFFLSFPFCHASSSSSKPSRKGYDCSDGCAVTCLYFVHVIARGPPRKHCGIYVRVPTIAIDGTHTCKSTRNVVNGSHVSGWRNGGEPEGHLCLSAFICASLPISSFAKP